MFQLNDYTYDLPDDRIAQVPATPPDHCRLLVYKNSSIQDTYFYTLPDLLPKKSMIIFNTSKVIKARLLLPEGEIFFLQHLSDNNFEALVRPGKHFRVGTALTRTPTEGTRAGKAISFTVLSQTEHGRVLTCSESIEELLEIYGQMPLPPYISYSPEKASSYQPIIAENPGSVAAPTASLHFTPEVLEGLKSNDIIREEVTLHVGLGTFQSVQTQDITKHDIHTERIIIDIGIFERLAAHKRAGHEITAVGTTVMRTLESLAFLRIVLSETDAQPKLSEEHTQRRNMHIANISLEDAKSIIHDVSVHNNHMYFSTKIFLYPGSKIRLVDGLITNFHLPKSSLLMLVAAFVGFEEMKHIYDHALAGEYMFYSFGDAMYLRKNTTSS